MTKNSSFYSYLHSNLSSVNSQLILDLYCIISSPSSFIFTTFYITSIFLLLPFSVIILYRGLQQWWQKPSTSLATISHSDIFTYHMVIMELICVIGGILCCCGIYKVDLNILSVGRLLYTYTAYGEIYFHILTCVDRYVAAVHPIMYLSLRQGRGIRVRNIGICSAWLLSFVGISLVMMENVMLFMDFCLLILSLTIVSFFSISVLCVLTHPSPGDQGGNRERVTQSKQRAFYTIVTILGAIVLRLLSGLLWVVLLESSKISKCVLISCAVWFNLPCSLVLPLLFLHKAGKKL